MAKSQLTLYHSKSEAVILALEMEKVIEIQLLQSCLEAADIKISINKFKSIPVALLAPYGAPLLR